MIYPVEIVRVTSPYGERSFDLWHYGVDFGNDSTQILAVEDGIVKVSKNNPNGYGEYIVIEHEDNYCSLYAHLSNRKVVEGQKVSKGEIIGIMGNTPKSRGLATHLHFEIRDIKYCSQFWDKTTKNGRKGVPLHCVDPIKFIEESNKQDNPSNWAAEAWEWGLQNKVTTGGNPKGNITREQVVQMIYNYHRRFYETD